MIIIGVIPARYKSSRFPGKPLADICGKPMIWWVYQQCKKVKDFSEVYVATDDDKIYEECQALGIQVIMTSDKHKTGTDRIGEVAEKIPADLIVNIQGDEPLLEPDTIRAAIEPFYTNPDLQVSNLMTKINDPASWASIARANVRCSKARMTCLVPITHACVSSICCIFIKLPKNAPRRTLEYFSKTKLACQRSFLAVSLVFLGVAVHHLGECYAGIHKILWHLRIDGCLEPIHPSYIPILILKRCKGR